MNRARRDLLKSAVFYLEKASDLVSTALDQEQDCLDNMPENLEASDRYEKMEAAVDCLEDAASSIEEAVDKITEASS